jgi:hypothetical protein
MPTTTSPAGYSYDAPDLPPSPVTPADLEALTASAAFTDADRDALRQAGQVLADQVEGILDVWYGFVGSQPQLLAYFSTPAGEPIGQYLSGVRGRFGQWILDTCNRDYDAGWLAYQHEIALRHTSVKKNRTDGVHSVPHIPLRYIVALIAPITATIRPFLASKGHTAEQVDAMHAAWTKSVIVQVALWSQPYAGPQW